MTINLTNDQQRVITYFKNMLTEDNMIICCLLRRLKWISQHYPDKIEKYRHLSKSGHYLSRRYITIFDKTRFEEKIREMIYLHKFFKYSKSISLMMTTPRDVKSGIADLMSKYIRLIHKDINQYKRFIALFNRQFLSHVSKYMDKQHKFVLIDIDNMDAYDLCEVAEEIVDKLNEIDVNVNMIVSTPSLGMHILSDSVQHIMKHRDEVITCLTYFSNMIEIDTMKSKMIHFPDVNENVKLLYLKDE